MKTINIHGKEYMPVAERVKEAHNDNKEALSIKTEVIATNDTHIVFKAIVVTKKGTFTGFSSVDTSSQKLIEKQNPYEVAETSAVGRALGFAGYGIVDSIASADEVVKAQNTARAVQNAPSPTVVPQKVDVTASERCQDCSAPQGKPHATSCGKV